LKRDSSESANVSALPALRRVGQRIDAASRQPLSRPLGYPILALLIRSGVAMHMRCDGARTRKQPMRGHEFVSHDIARFKHER
jgi:hypothetical protein